MHKDAGRNKSIETWDKKIEKIKKTGTMENLENMNMENFRKIGSMNTEKYLIGKYQKNWKYENLENMKK